MQCWGGGVITTGNDRATEKGISWQIIYRPQRASIHTQTRMVRVTKLVMCCEVKGAGLRCGHLRLLSGGTPVGRPWLCLSICRRSPPRFEGALCGMGETKIPRRGVQFLVVGVVPFADHGGGSLSNPWAISDVSSSSNIRYVHDQLCPCHTTAQETSDGDRFIGGLEVAICIATPSPSPPTYSSTHRLYSALLCGEKSNITKATVHSKIPT